MRHLSIITQAIFAFVSLIALAYTDAIPETLSLTIVNKLYDERINLNLRRTPQYLANHNLPVWYAWKDGPQLIPNLMKSFEEFIMYQDIDKSAAVVLTGNTQLLFGVIDTRFIISALPLSSVQPNIYHKVNGPYVHTRTNHDGLHDHFHTGFNFPYASGDMQHTEILDNELPPFNTNPENEQLPDRNQAGHSVHSHVHNQPRRSAQSYEDANLVAPPPNGEILYPEILIFVSNNIVENAMASREGMLSLIAYYLVELNAIDMLFAKLNRHGITIHINIAGFVLEAEPLVFPYKFTQHPTQPFECLEAYDTLRGFPEYIRRYQTVFSQDSFDFFFLSTTYELVSSGTLSGLAVSRNIFENRNDIKAPFISSGMVVKRTSISSNFITGAHELAHLMEVEHDPPKAGLRHNVQCYGILQSETSSCRFCIDWSIETVDQLKNYISHHKGSCFLRNFPRSLHPHGVAMRTLGPREQCRCYGFESYWQPIGTHLAEIPRHACNKKLVCAGTDGSIHLEFPRPFDGTPCGENEVCWNRQCRELLQF